MQGHEQPTARTKRELRVERNPLAGDEIQAVPLGYGGECELRFGNSGPAVI